VGGLTVLMTQRVGRMIRNTAWCFSKD